MSDYPPPPPGGADPTSEGAAGAEVPGTDPSETVWHAPPPPGGDEVVDPVITPPVADVPTAPVYTPPTTYPPQAPAPGYAPPPPAYPPQPPGYGAAPQGYPPQQPGYPPQQGYAQPGYAAAPPAPGYGAAGYAPVARPPAVGPDGRPLKSKMTAGLLGIFLGAFGVHRFYLGYAGIGIAQIVVTIVTCGMGAIWGLIEGILILTGSPSFSTDAEGRPLTD